MRRVLAAVLTAWLALSAAGAWWWSGPWRDLESAERALEAGDPEAALARLGRAESWRRTRDRALILRARAALARGRPGEAVGPLDAVDPSGPLAGEAAYWKGRTLLAAGQSRRALEWLRAAGRDRPDDPEVLRWTAAAAYELGDRAAARSALEALTGLRPGDAPAWRTLALLHKEAADPERARPAYERALRLDPAQPRARLELAEVLLEHGDADAAERQLARCRGGVPEVDRLAVLARAQRLREDFEGLRATLRAGLAADPDRPELLAIQAGLDLAEGRPAEAVDRLDRALAVAPFVAELHYRRGLARRALGLDAEARADLGRASALRADLAELSRLDEEASRRPDDAGLRVEIGRLCERLGKPELAATWYAAALACDPERAEARRALDALRAGPRAPGVNP